MVCSGTLSCPSRCFKGRTRALNLSLGPEQGSIIPINTRRMLLRPILSRTWLIGASTHLTKMVKLLLKSPGNTYIDRHSCQYCWPCWPLVMWFAASALQKQTAGLTRLPAKTGPSHGMTAAPRLWPSNWRQLRLLPGNQMRSCSQLTGGLKLLNKRLLSTTKQSRSSRFSSHLSPALIDNVPASSWFQRLDHTMVNLNYMSLAHDRDELEWIKARPPIKDWASLTPAATGLCIDAQSQSTQQTLSLPVLFVVANSKSVHITAIDFIYFRFHTYWNLLSLTSASADLTLKHRCRR